MSDIQITIRTEGGNSDTVNAPQEMQSGEFIADLIPGLKLPLADPQGNRIPWILVDKGSGRSVDPEKSLHENGIRNGHVLYLSVRETLSLVVHIPDVKDFSEAISQRVTVKDFVQGVSARFDLGRASLWQVYDKDLGRFLESDKSLVENGVRSGHHLHLEKSKPFPVKTLALVAAGLLLVLIIWFMRGSFSSIITTPGNSSAGEQPNEADPKNTPRPPTPRGSVEVRPASIRLGVSGETTFNATVNGDPKAGVTWTLSPSVGRIRPDGRYSAPPSIGADQLVTVTATSVTDKSLSGSASLSLQAVKVAVLPATVELGPSQEFAFSATVDGSSNKDVQWLLSGPGRIAQSGVYTAPSAATRGSIIVRAMSKADPTKFGSATVNIGRGFAGASPGSGPPALNPPGKSSTPATPVSPSAAITTPNRGVTPSAPRGVKPAANPFRVEVSNATLGASQRQKLNAFLNGVQESAVEWSLSGAGRIAQDGTYTAPSPIRQEETVTIKAVSKADQTKVAVATILLKPIAVSISPATAELLAGGKARFQATVANAPSRDVKWSVMGAGEVSKDGVYSAPSSIRQDQVVQVVAASREDNSRSATATVRLKTYSGKRAGTLTWSGKMPKDVTTTVEGGNASIGSVTGDPFPGVPVRIELDNEKDLKVVVRPDDSNGWKRLVLQSKKNAESNLSVKIIWTVR